MSHRQEGGGASRKIGMCVLLSFKAVNGGNIVGELLKVVGGSMAINYGGEGIEIEFSWLTVGSGKNGLIFVFVLLA